MKMKKTIVILCGSMALSLSARAQEELTPQQVLEQRVSALESATGSLQRLKVSGYVQVQNQWGEAAASLKTGVANENPEASFSRLGIRRGRIKFTYGMGIASAVFQLDATEKGLGIKDAYLNIKDPWIGTMALKGGVFDRPFGYEISYSSSLRESPERSTVFQTLFPEERDLGVLLTLQAPKTSPWNIFKLEAGLFAGNGIKPETDNRRDFIGHLSLSRDWNRLGFGAGVSYYNGGVYQGTAGVYSISGSGFTLDDRAENLGAFARRQYTGLDARVTLDSPLGLTKLHGEYLFGRQPGGVNKTNSPNAAARPATDTYLRDFAGGYAMLVQYLGGSPLALVAKYDWYDPNTAVSGDAVGRDGTTAADQLRQTVGTGALFNLNPGIRLTAYYEWNKNEGKELKDNVFTLRLQYKF